MLEFIGDTIQVTLQSIAEMQFTQVESKSLNIFKKIYCRECIFIAISEVMFIWQL